MDGADRVGGSGWSGQVVRYFGLGVVDQAFESSAMAAAEDEVGPVETQSMEELLA